MSQFPAKKALELCSYYGDPLPASSSHVKMESTLEERAASSPLELIHTHLCSSKKECKHKKICTVNFEGVLSSHLPGLSKVAAELGRDVGQPEELSHLDGEVSIWHQNSLFCCSIGVLSLNWHTI